VIALVCSCGLVRRLAPSEQVPGTVINCTCGGEVVFPTPDEWAAMAKRMHDPVTYTDELIDEEIEP